MPKHSSEVIKSRIKFARRISGPDFLRLVKYLQFRGGKNPLINSGRGGGGSGPLRVPCFSQMRPRSFISTAPFNIILRNVVVLRWQDHVYHNRKFTAVYNTYRLYSNGVVISCIRCDVSSIDTYTHEAISKNGCWPTCALARSRNGGVRPRCVFHQIGAGMFFRQVAAKKAGENVLSVRRSHCFDMLSCATYHPGQGTRENVPKMGVRM